MPYKEDKKNRNAAQRAYRASNRLTKPTEDRVGKTPFASFCHIPPGRIEALADDIFHTNIIMGPLTFHYRKYDANSGQLFMFKRGDDANALAGAWIACVLRPMIVAAIENKFDIELTHFDAEPADRRRRGFMEARSRYLSRGSLTITSRAKCRLRRWNLCRWRWLAVSREMWPAAGLRLKFDTKWDWDAA